MKPKRRYRYGGWLALAVTVTVLASGCASADGGSSGDSNGDSIVIGAPLELSGSVASLGVDARDGAELAVEEINGDGGLLDQDVRLEVRDNRSTPETAVEEGTALADEGVDMMLNPVSSGAALAVSSSVSAPRDILLMNSVASANSLVMEEFQDGIFSVAPNSVMESRGHAIHMAEAGYGRIAMLGADYEAGHSNLTAFREYMEEEHPEIEIVEEIYHPMTEVDFSSYVSRFEAAEPDGIYYQFIGDALINFTRQADQLGLLDQADLMGFFDTTVLDALGDEAPVGTLAMGRAPFFALEGDRAEGFVERYTEAYDRPPSAWAISAYDAVMVWARAVEEAGSTEKDDVSEALLSQEFETLRGTISFRDVDHQADVPLFFGTVGPVDPEYGFPIWENVTRIDGERTMPDAAEVERRREG